MSTKRKSDPKQKPDPKQIDASINSLQESLEELKKLPFTNCQETRIVLEKKRAFQNQERAISEKYGDHLQHTADLRVQRAKLRRVVSAFDEWHKNFNSVPFSRRRNLVKTAPVTVPASTSTKKENSNLGATLNQYSFARDFSGSSSELNNRAAKKYGTEDEVGKEERRGIEDTIEKEKKEEDSLLNVEPKIQTQNSSFQLAGSEDGGKTAASRSILRRMDGDHEKSKEKRQGRLSAATVSEEKRSSSKSYSEQENDIQNGFLETPSYIDLEVCSRTTASDYLENKADATEENSQPVSSGPTIHSNDFKQQPEILATLVSDTPHGESPKSLPKDCDDEQEIHNASSATDIEDSVNNEPTAMKEALNSESETQGKQSNEGKDVKNVFNSSDTKDPTVNESDSMGNKSKTQKKMKNVANSGAIEIAKVTTNLAGSSGSLKQQKTEDRGFPVVKNDGTVASARKQKRSLGKFKRPTPDSPDHTPSERITETPSFSAYCSANSESEPDTTILSEGNDSQENLGNMNRVLRLRRLSPRVIDAFPGFNGEAEHSSQKDMNTSAKVLSLRNCTNWFFPENMPQTKSVVINTNSHSAATFEKALKELEYHLAESNKILSEQLDFLRISKQCIFFLSQLILIFCFLFLQVYRFTSKPVSPPT